MTALVGRISGAVREGFLEAAALCAVGLFLALRCRRRSTTCGTSRS